MTLLRQITLHVWIRMKCIARPALMATFAVGALATSDLIKPKMALLMHHGTTPALVGAPEQYIEALGSTSVKVLSAGPGGTLEF